MTIKLTAAIRKEIGKQVKKLRAQDLIPAVIYGHGVTPQNVSVKLLEFTKALNQAGESSILELVTEKETFNVLIHDIQNDPMSGKPSHIDFFAVRMDEAVETDVELVFVGESEAVKALGGILVKNMDSVPVKALPAHLPKEIEVSIEKLKTFEDHVTVADLKVSDKVEIQLELEAVVALVMAPRSEEELANLDTKVEADVTKVEGVIKETPTEEKK